MHYLLFVLFLRTEKEKGCPSAKKDVDWKTSGRIIGNDDVEASTRKPQAPFQIIKVSFSPEPRMIFE